MKTHTKACRIKRFASNETLSSFQSYQDKPNGKPLKIIFMYRYHVRCFVSADDLISAKFWSFFSVFISLLEKGECG